MSKIPKNIEVLTRIYTLSCPITKEIRYVGKTVKTLEQRLKAHIWDSINRPNTTHKFNWIKSLLNKNLKPVIHLIENCKWFESSDREIYWIDCLKKSGYNLVNHTIGGEGRLGYKASEKTKRKQSKSISKAIGVKVYKYSLEGYYLKSYKTTTNAAKENSCLDSKIRLVCIGSRRKTGGFRWSYNKVKFLGKMPFSKHKGVSEKYKSYETYIKAIQNLKHYDKF